MTPEQEHDHTRLQAAIASLARRVAALEAAIGRLTQETDKTPENAAQGD